MTYDTNDVVNSQQHFSNEKKGSLDEKPVTVTPADGPEPHLVPTAEDLRTLPRVPAGMP